jgi:hypothetical protein
MPEPMPLSPTEIVVMRQLPLSSSFAQSGAMPSSLPTLKELARIFTMHGADFDVQG